MWQASLQMDYSLLTRNRARMKHWLFALFLMAQVWGLHLSAACDICTGGALSTTFYFPASVIFCAVRLSEPGTAQERPFTANMGQSGAGWRETGKAI